MEVKRDGVQIIFDKDLIVNTRMEKSAAKAYYSWCYQCCIFNVT